MSEKKNQSNDKSIKYSNSNKEKAKKLFAKAINYEYDENFLKATKFYQEAVKLYPKILNIYTNENSENIDKNESTEENDNDKNSYLINILSKNFYSIIKFLDFYSMHRFHFLCKNIYSLISLENEYKRLCEINFTKHEEKIKLYENSYKRLLLEYPRIRYDGVYISCITYIRPLKDIGNIHLDPKDRDRVIYNPCFITYFRYLLFLNESNKVLILRSEVNKKEVLEALKISYNKIKKWNLLLSCDELIKDLLKFQSESENNIVKFIRIGEYKFNKDERIIEIHYSELLNEPNKYKNLIQLRLQNYLSGNNNMLKWVSFKILSKIKFNYSEDTLNINNKQYRSFFFFNLKFLSHLFITKISEN
ncbi:DNA replication origin binding protein, putative [Plasmodium gallinaceum]|uniref:DNA replication origin binding protein, putative n=1 Tax=Plasmodium gallinaceum TaxID=5849 RepID=A0A1J1GXV6_PLAGA|nr:DNA replication origin binding protein, putative [Plasmodium gallinaceum]CRG97096.1 DNA replication origin binding protein, putative [Plasmodium gallinaceum]